MNRTNRKLNVQEALQTAIKHHQNGDLKQAEIIYNKILQADPRNADVLHLLGVIAHQTGKSEKAVEFINKAIDANKAVPFYHNNAGEAYRALGRLDEAIGCYRRAVSLKPDYFEAYYNLGSVLALQGRLDDAIDSYKRAASLRPDSFETYFNMGNIFAKQWKMEEAVESFRRAVSLKPDFPEAYYNLGNGLADLGRPEEAKECYRKVLTLKYSDGIRIKLAALPQIIMPSTESILNFRMELDHALDDLLDSDIVLNDPLQDVGQTNFFLAYHGLENRELQVKAARLYEKACPGLLYTAPHCKKAGTTERHERTRIGFISSNFHNHTIGKHFRGVIAGLSRELFNVYVFFAGKIPDGISQFIESKADRPVVLEPSLEAARRQIAECELDILFYTDIGMDPFTYFLAFSRLAPVQCVTWGHPDTTGIPNMDYYISCEDFEAEDPEPRYSERLVRMKNVPHYFYRPEHVASAGKREIIKRLGLPEDMRLYAVPQHLFKFHPDFDAVLAGILRRDERGLLILFEGLYKSWGELLMARFSRSIPDVTDRIVFLPHLAYPDFLSFMRSADSILDTPFFCGGTTSLEIFSVGAPIVTWPGSRMASRFTYAYYKKMNIMDLIAHDGEEYIQLATRLANDGEWKRQLGARILEKNRIFYDNMEPVRELENFFRSVSGAGRQECR